MLYHNFGRHIEFKNGDKHFNDMYVLLKNNSHFILGYLEDIKRDGWFSQSISDFKKYHDVEL